MIEVECDLWGFSHCDAKVITTNGSVTGAGVAVMGRGVARQAATRWPDIPLTLGNMITTSGLHVGSLGNFSYQPHLEVHIPTAYQRPTRTFELVSFPVKEQWQHHAQLWLIRRSCEELVQLADYKDWTFVQLPRPGCGNGGLTWDQVQPLLTGILDNRFQVTHLSGITG
jgi:hypothetical protein